MENYNDRSVKEWIRMADAGEIALPIFQRSYVWDNNKIENYLHALFDGRPTGSLLVLKAAKPPQFESRGLKNNETDLKEIQELILDGQQRLTSLWRALKRKAESTFYVEVQDFNSDTLKVIGVKSFIDSSTESQSLIDPETAFRQNLIPIHILLDKVGKVVDEADKLGPIWNWCHKVFLDAVKSGILTKKIKDSIQSPFLDARQWYFPLSSETDAKVAIDIFIETNKSSVKIKPIDVVVALAQGQHGENLRERIVSLYKTSQHIKYYFHDDQERWIPEIGEWLFKVACLKSRDTNSCPKGLPPKESNYEKVLDNIFCESGKKGQKKLDLLHENLDHALEIAMAHGGVSSRTLPSWPVIHVVAALHHEIGSIKKPAWEGVARELITSYIWRAAFTSRHDRQANDSLYEDYCELIDCINEIKKTGNHQTCPTIFQSCIPSKDVKPN